MPNGIPNKRYIKEFKQTVIETMRREKLRHKEAARLYGILRMTVWPHGNESFRKKARKDCTLSAVAVEARGTQRN